MARKIKEVVIADEGRDKGKSFVLTEMDAVRAEKWAMRALLLAAQAGVQIPSGITGMAGVAVAGIQAVMGVRFDDVEPLLDEMMSCVAFRPAPRDPNPDKAALTRPLFPDDIEEVLTRVKLREEIIELHLGFSVADYLSKLTAGSAKPKGSESIETSPQP